jgi:ribosome-binding factor A
VPKEYPRAARLNQQLMRDLAALLREELADPRVQGVTVTNVDVSPDLRNARVRVSLLGDDAALELAIRTLNRVSGRLRHGLSLRLQLRRVPALTFVPDRAMREGDRVNALIRQVREQDRAAAAGNGVEPGDDAPHSR